MQIDERPRIKLSRGKVFYNGISQTTSFTERVLHLFDYMRSCGFEPPLPDVRELVQGIPRPCSDGSDMLLEASRLRADVGWCFM